MTERLPQGHCVQCKTGVIKGMFMLCKECRKNPRPITYGLSMLGKTKKIVPKILRQCEKLNCDALIKRGRYCMAHGDEPYKQAMRRAAEKRKKQKQRGGMEFFNTRL